MKHHLELAIGLCATLALAMVFIEVAWRLKGPNALLRNMRERALSCWLLLAAGLPLLALPFAAMVAMVGLMALVAFWEFARALRLSRGATRTGAFVVLPLTFLGVGSATWQPLAFALGVAVLTSVRSERNGVARLVVICGAAGCVWGLAALAALAAVGGGLGAGVMLLVLVVAQLSDAGQYLVGKLFGRHRLAPRLSPGKTWEGLLGGWAVACAVGTALHPVWGLDPFRAALFSAVACVCGFFGGLCFSAIKRRVGLKDWGSWLKGHGGMLDRVDSLVLSAPACWALLMAGA